jgi:hypothetical protein
MKKLIGRVFVALLVAVLGGPARADNDKETKAIIDMAIKAIGGEQKLAAVRAVTWKVQGKLYFLNKENDFTRQVTVQGLDHYRNETPGEMNGTSTVIVLSGDKGWLKLPNNMKRALDEKGVAGQKRTVFRLLAATTIVPLRAKGTKLAKMGEEMVGDKPAVGVKITEADGMEFTLYFDKETGLPVKEVEKFAGAKGNDERIIETIFGDYRDFGGIKKATKIETKVNGQKQTEQEITDFKVLDKVDPNTFSEPD